MRSSVKNGGFPRLRAIGTIRSAIKTRAEAPRQVSEGAPDAWLAVSPSVALGLDGLKSGDEIIVVTWLHKARHDTLKVHPRSDRSRPLMAPSEADVFQQGAKAKSTTFSYRRWPTPTCLGAAAVRGARIRLIQMRTLISLQLRNVGAL
jgi:hypothetical protein